MRAFPTLYKRDSSGRVRVWWMQLDGARHQTCHGLMDGAITESGWTTCEPRSRPTAEAQAEFEVEAQYTHQLDREYHRTIETIDDGKFFQVMLADKYVSFPGRGFSQPKLDGFRCRATKAGLFTRQGKEIVAAPHIREALEPFFAENPDAVLDGELYSHALREDFEELSSILRKVKPTAEHLARSRETIQYWVYDYISEGKHPFGQRIQLLAVDLARYMGDVIVATPTMEVTTQLALDELEEQYLQAGFEGQMVRLDAPYEQKRSKTLLKRKRFQDGEFVCVRIEPGNGNWAGLAKRVICRLPDGREFGAGIKGNKARAAQLLTETHHEVTVRFFRYTLDGIPYLPVVTAFHGERRAL